MVVAVAGIRDLANLGCEVLADSWDFAQPVDVQRCELVRMICRDVGDVAIRANLERVLALDLEQIGNLLEDARNRPIIQPAGLPSRWRNRARALPRRGAPIGSPRAQRAA